MSDYLASLLLILACVSARAGEYTLRFDRPARFFEESCLIGNGTAGAAIYGDPLCDTITLNDITLWSGEPLSRHPLPDRSEKFLEVRQALAGDDYRKADSLQHFLQWHNSAVYQPAGMIEIEYIDHAPVAEYERRLDIDSALVTTRVVTSGGHSRVTRYFASAPDSLIVID
ncbi:MAG: glycoside hydrolase family 95 protein, partial [Duncaniella sp.]|nr:glycoside hydrolase family 95 protein [Duncaniella sp.]